MIKFIIQFLFFYCIWKSNCKQKGKWFLPSSLLLGLYMLSSALAVPTLYFGYYTEPYSGHYWIPMIQFSVLVLLFILPFSIFDESRIHKIILPSKNFLNIVSTVLIILSFYAILFHISTARDVLSSGDIRAIRIMISSGEGYSEGGILNTIASVSSSLYVFAIAFFFIYLILEGFNKRTILLFISSFSESIHVLTFAGRDGIVFWLFSFIFLWALFNKYLPHYLEKRLKKMLLYAGIVMVIPFLMITVSRFGEGSEEDGTVYSIISYMGQGFVNGPLYFGLDNPPVSHSGFTLINEILHQSPTGQGSLLEYGDWKSWTFGTLVVSLYIILGGIGMLCFGLGALFLFLIVLGKKKYSVRINHIIIYILYFQVVSQGVFYFCQQTRGGNLFILLCLLGALFSGMFLKSDYPVVITPSQKAG